MKTLRNTAIVGLIIITGLYIKNGRDRMNKSLKTIETVAVEMVSPAPEAPPEVPKAIPVAIVRELLPDGEYVTLDRIKEVTPDGVKAIAKGTKVKLIEQKEDKLIISDSKVTLSALASELTNDKEKATSLIEEALANEPLPLPAPTNTEAKTEAKPREEIRKPDYSFHIAQLDKRINDYKEKIKELKFSRRGKISANGALIARLELEMAPLESERNRLLNARR